MALTTINWPDSQKALFGTGDDLQISHDGSHSYIHQDGTGGLKILADTFRVNNEVNNEHIIKGNANGNVELYYDNVKKFETTSTGATLSHSNTNATASNWSGAHISIKNTHDTDNNASVVSFVNSAGGTDAAIQGIHEDAAGSGSARRGHIQFGTSGSSSSGSVVERMRITGAGNVSIPNDGGAFTCGTGDDLQIYHNGTHSYVQGSTGNLLLRPKSGEDGVTIVPDGSVHLAYDDATKISTKSHGVNITDGELRIGDADDGNDALIRLGATGTNVDTHGVIYYDKSDNYISMIVSGESHGSGGVYVENGGKVRCGAGIKLGGTGDANLLDDYEEGTWTPALTNGPTLNGTSGRYVKIGNQVFCYFAITTSTDGIGAHVRINNLPFGSINTAPNCGGISWDYRNSTNLRAHQSQGTTNLYFYFENGSAMEGNDTDFEGKDLRACVMYQV